VPRTTRKDRTPRRRTDPETRRREIIDAARPLFSERPISQITLADVAEAAGCSRALVHSYFGGIPKLFLAVVAEAGAGLVEARKPRPGAPLEERIALNAAESLDVIEQNRETWWGVIGHRSSGNPDIDALAEAITNFNVQRVLDNNAGLIEDTHETRMAIRALIALSTEVTRQWLTDQITRPQAEALLTVSYVEVLRTAIPAMEKASAGAGDAG
jgi:AcrR family transcriptional regulator